MSVLVHPSAQVADGAELAEGVVVGPYCVVGSRVCIGAGSRLEAFVRVHDFVTLGSDCCVHENTVLGGAPQDRSYKGEETWLHIGDGNIIRENVTINRGTGEGGETVVGDRCFLMAGVHLAHNVRLGDEVTLTNNVPLAGYVTVGSHTVFGGMSGAHQFTRVGSYCMIGGLYRVIKDVPPYTLASGDPLRLKGLNSVGLRRAGFSAAMRRDILNFYRRLYRKDVLFSQSLKEALAEKESLAPELRVILDFYEGSRRGVTFWDTSGHSAHEPD
ncbi:MAG: acyl-ACP--UDP-N-acetylglucosamine O-acyltransferase [Fretibacterium sp.]|nr:acyl-ACP--UDP-N-acetylglucosamine O-acyltransferase [Fretibacterium sp.]